MATVILTAKGIGDKPFNIEYAQNILNVGAKHPPKTWALNDPDYTLVDGVITAKPAITPEPEVPNPITPIVNATNAGTDTKITEGPKK